MTLDIRVVHLPIVIAWHIHAVWIVFLGTVAMTLNKVMRDATCGRLRLEELALLEQTGHRRLLLAVRLLVEGWRLVCSSSVQRLSLRDSGL